MHTTDSISVTAPTEAFRWPRLTVAHCLADDAATDPAAQRHRADRYGVPRSTLYYWQARQAAIDLDPAVVQFWESPVGLAFLHRLVAAAHLLFGQVAPCGLRPLCRFLQLTGLDRFVAASYGAQYQVARALQDALLDFGAEERQRLAATMSPKKITLCEDETFHPQTCLVAVEPVSGYLVLEVYAPQRDAATWTVQVQAALAGLPVEVLQVTSDEARGLLAHARDGLGAHHSPDLFHVLQELTRGASGPLALQTRRANEAQQAAQQQVTTLQQTAAAVQEQCPGTVVAYAAARRARTAQDAAAAASASRQACEQRQQQAADAIRAISTAYHPFALATGAAQEPSAVAQQLTAQFDTIAQVAQTAGLSEQGQQKIAKARKLLPALVGTMAFFG
jgi:hypothetical protein